MSHYYHIWEEEGWLPGVLSKNQIQKLIEKEYFEGVSKNLKDFDYSSFDLHIDNQAFKLLSSIKPCGGDFISNMKNEGLIKEINPNNEGYYKLIKKNCYLFKLKENFNFKFFNNNFFGQATAKSTIGRLDIIARLVVHGMRQYEFLSSTELQNQKSSGKMYLEIIPISFNIEIKENDSLSQLRLFYGSIENSKISDKEFIMSILKGSEDGDDYLSVNTTLCKNPKYSAFKAKLNNNYCIKIDSIKESIEPNDYWEGVKSDINHRLLIEKDNFYILRSKEKICLPSGVSVYCRAIDESLGEMRIHYAGFVHPFFGFYRKDGSKGTPLIFEVRGHNVNVSLKDGERLAKLEFYRMSENSIFEPVEDDPYMDQELQLSKYFKNWND